MVLPQIVLRAVTLFGGIAVERSINKMLPVTKDLFKADPIAVTIGTAIIQVAASDVVMSYIENRLITALDSIALPAPEELEVIEPVAQPVQPKPAAKPAKQTSK